MMRSLVSLAFASAWLAAMAYTAPAMAQLTTKKTLSLEVAKRLAVAAEAEAKKNSWPVVIVLVDDAGHLVYLQRLDEAQYGSIEVATGKAQTAAAFKRPTKALEDSVTGGRSVLLRLPATPIEGGLPLTVDGKIVGAIGVSGVTSQQDGMVAQAGVNALPDILKQSAQQ
jgi:uncharacterized protein GlcG (DUF336 family)